MEEEQQQRGFSSGKNEDVINAIHYQIAFKSALTSSSIYAESIMASKIKEGHNVGSQELS